MYAQRGDNIQEKQLSSAEGSLSITVDSKTNCEEVRMKAQAAIPRQLDEIKTSGESQGLIVLLISWFKCLIYLNTVELCEEKLST